MLEQASTALLTDYYELTMLQSALLDGTAHNQATFEVFARSLPYGRRFGVVAGIGRLVEAIQNFHFSSQDIAFLSQTTSLNSQTLAYLASYQFKGSIYSYKEGDLYFPFSPILTVTGTFAEAVLLETLILSILNHDSAIASAAARMKLAAGSKQLIEMGSRRTHEFSAFAAARAAYLTGFTATSNLKAGQLYNVPTRGTSAHAFILAHTSELEAFKSQLASLGTDTTLLVDTYDITQGIHNAVAAAHSFNINGPGAIRIDSGDFYLEIPKARALLDSLGATYTKILVSGDMDEYSITELNSLPVDAFGVGTSLVTGSGAPTAGFVYKLVSISDLPDSAQRPVAKRSANKASVGGRKVAYRLLDEKGHAYEEKVVVRFTDDFPSINSLDARALQHPLFIKGTLQEQPSLAQSRAFHSQVISELKSMHLSINKGTPALDATPS